MKTEPVVAAAIDFGGAGEPPRSARFGDVYFPDGGAARQARHVFLDGNGLPERWRGRRRFVVLETGFGLGNNFLATWDAWRRDPARCERLVFVSIERHPPTRADLARAHAPSGVPALAARLVDAWPPLVPALHAIDFDAARVRLLLAFGDVAAWLPALRLQADAVFLDGFAPAVNPDMWQRRVFKALRTRTAPDATAATWSVARPVRDGLVEAGFAVERRPGTGGKREITVARRCGPAAADETPDRRAIVVGAGLAGAFTARALVDEGWAVTVVDRHAAPAGEASGNAAALFHATVHADDGPHARLLRHGASLAARTVRAARGDGVAGAVDGLLRIDRRGLAAMQPLVGAHGLPPDWVQPLPAAAASERAGVRLDADAWLHVEAGWADPAALAAWALRRDGIRFVGSADIARIAHGDDGWRAIDAGGRTVAAAPVLVAANAFDAARLVAAHAAAWPLVRERGQVSAWHGGPTALRLPIAGDGYAIPLADGLLCGATRDDGTDAVPDGAAHAANLARLLRLTAIAPPGDAVVEGRVGWRTMTADRLPVAGPVATGQAPALRAEQPRGWPRSAGLHVCTALGGRGLTLAPLLGRVVAAGIAGSPPPLDGGLLDAIDPARFLARAVRRL